MSLLPLITGRAWISLPSEVFRTFNGQSRLPVFEIDKKNVQKPYARVRPLPQASGDLSFSAWDLAHALKKADCARWPSSTLLWTGTVGFLLEHAQLFDWSSSDLRLNPGMSDFYADFTRTSIAGRVAQGMALLFLEKEGYTFVARFDSTIRNVSTGKSSSRTRRRKPKEPDFIVENGSKEQALAEAKGGFVPANENSYIKGDLKAALEQLSSGTTSMVPQPSKSFAVGTYLREVDDCSGEPSLIAYTDPPPDEPDDPVEFPEDVVRRANYASWLALMGLDGGARRLWTRSGEPERRTVPIIAVGKRKYVVSVASVRPEYGRDPVDGTFWHNTEDWLFWPFGPFPDGIALELVGLDLEVVESLEIAIRDPSQAEELMAIQPMEETDIPLEVDGGAFYGSVFSDFSLLGEIRIRRGQRPEFGLVDIEL